MQNGETIPLVGRTEFTLGRVSEGQPLIPELDLSKYKAYDQGVSRLHAVLAIQTDQVTITDLGSANGTWLNGVRLPPHTVHTLKNGDLVSLGTMKIQAVIEQ
jgi:pSer/pThr/pTyr-binding forkhead associated (FHA) protein